MRIAILAATFIKTIGTVIMVVAYFFIYVVIAYIIGCVWHWESIVEAGRGTCIAAAIPMQENQIALVQRAASIFSWGETTPHRKGKCCPLVWPLQCKSQTLASD